MDSERKAILDRLEPDFPNIRAAWLWAVKTKNLDELGDSVEVLSEILSNNHREAVELIDKAIAQLDETNPEHHLSLSKLYLQQVKHIQWLNVSNEQTINKGFEFAKLANYHRGIAQGTLLTTDIFDSDKLKDVQFSPFEEGFKLTRQHGTANDIADYYCCELQYKRSFATPDEVDHYFGRASAELKELEDYVTLVEIKLTYGAFLVYQNRFEEGHRLLSESLALNHQLGKKIVYSVLFSELGYVNYKMGKLDEAISFFEDAIQTATQMGWLSNRTKALGYLSRIAIAQNNQEQANRHLQEIHFMDYFNHRSESGQEIHNECDLYQNVPWNFFFEALIAFAEYQVKFEDAQKGLAILQYISEHRYTEP